VAEVNNPPGGIRVMPLPGGWRPLPVGITFYRSKSNETWKPQLLSDMDQVHLHTSVHGKDFSIMSLYGRMRYLIHLRERWHGSAGRK
jgi:hypothetical protein